MMLKRTIRIALILVACVACSLPLAIVTGVFTAPLWNAFEARTGIESYGHSGPSDWVYEMLWIVWTGVLIGAVFAVRNRSKAATTR
jgi:uncharacterized membrane protein